MKYDSYSPLRLSLRAAEYNSTETFSRRMRKKDFLKLHWILSSQFGLDLRLAVKGILRLPRYLIDLRTFKRDYSGRIGWVPCLHDRTEEGGSTRNEYFWQDLLVARRIFEANPKRHVDVGSRVDGFVAHVASFREIEVFDIRHTSTKIPGVAFKKADLMHQESLRGFPTGYCDSLSCLHAIEHFGLGRYGDPIDPIGHERGIANMAVLLAPGGTFYLSTPIGRERVEFNANRVFDPRNIIGIANRNGLLLGRLTTIVGGAIRELGATPEHLAALASEDYNLGLFEFIKK